ncbi:MAG: CPCC family cysteine-rich protein [Dehalococcoidia bacterium]|nr:CPCC family cysteine-rich protein [Dehalococcoidia bacterium]
MGKTIRFNFADPNYAGGANKVGINQARINYRLFDSIDEGSLRYVRQPLDSEKP